MFNMLSYIAQTDLVLVATQNFILLPINDTSWRTTEDGSQEIAGRIAWGRQQSGRDAWRTYARILPLAADVALARARSRDAAVPSLLAQSRPDRAAMAHPACADGG